MTNHLKEIKVFISHATDCCSESDKECEIVKTIIKEESNNHFIKQGYCFKPICFRDLTGGSGKPQEDLIDPPIKESEIVFFIIKNKMGTMRDGNKTGVEHEYDLAKEQNKEILVFFLDFEIRPSLLDPKQLSFINEFKRKIEEELFYRISLNLKDFESFFRSDFSNTADRFIKKNNPINQQIPLKKEFSELSRGFDE